MALQFQDSLLIYQTDTHKFEIYIYIYIDDIYLEYLKSSWSTCAACPDSLVVAEMLAEYKYKSIL